MKRTVALIMAILLAACSILAGCGADSPASSSKPASSAVTTNSNYGEANELFHNSQYIEALLKLSLISANDEMYADAQVLREEVNEALISEVDALVESKEYVEAFEILDAAKLALENESPVEGMREDIGGQYVVDTLNDAKVYFDNRDIEPAVGLLDKANGIYPDQRLADVLEEYSLYLPTLLTDMPTIEMQGFEVRTQSDSFGNTYQNAFILYNYGENSGFDPADAEFSLTRRFNRLSGTIVCSSDQNMMKPEESVFFEIYADGVLVYESGEMTLKTEPMSFELDVTDVQFLRIVTHTSNFGLVILADAIAYNQPIK